jgi:hypothetical protein
MPQIDGVADHAAPEDTADGTDTAAGAGAAGAVEPKVTAATAAATVASFLLWLLGAYVFRGEVPQAVQGVVLFAVTGGSTFMAGYLARHVDRKG